MHRKRSPLLPPARSRLAGLVLGLIALAGAAGPAEADEATAPPAVDVWVFEAPVGAVWEVFTTPAGWRAMGVAEVRMDFRVGGTVRTHYQAGGDLDGPGAIENTILAYTPQRMIALRATQVPEAFPFPREIVTGTWHVMRFEDLGGERTRVVSEAHGYPDTGEARRMRDFFAKANDATMKRVGEHLRGEESPSPLRPIHASVLVAAAPAAVFRSWSTSEGITGFLGVPANVELAVGGPYELHFAPDAPEGSRGTEGCEVLSWLPDRMISFTWNAPPSLPAARPKHTRVVVEIEPIGATHCLVHLTHAGFADQAAREGEQEETWTAVRGYFAQAWPRVLAALQRHHAAD